MRRYFTTSSGNKTTKASLPTVHTLRLSPQPHQFSFLPANAPASYVRDVDSITVDWTIAYEREEKNEDATMFDVEVRCHKKTNTLFSSGRKTRVVRTKELKANVTFDDLKPGTSYSIDARARRGVTDGKDVAWGSWGKRCDPIVVETRTLEISDRINLARRTDEWLRDALEAYELEHVPDTALDKAERIATGALEVVRVFGGTYGKIAHAAWQVKRVGIGAIVFRAELQKVVVAVASILAKEAKRKGLGHKDLTFGVYYMLWLRHAERVRDPERVRHIHEAGKMGVLDETTRPEELSDVLSWLPIAWSQYRKTCAEQQWLLQSYGFQLIFSSPYASKIRDAKTEDRIVHVVKPAFAVVVHRERKLAVVTVRGTKSIEGFLADSNHEAGSIVSIEDNDGDENAQNTCHSGMYAAARFVLDEMGLRSTLERLHNDAGLNVVLCGHSLGAGVCVMMAVHLVATKCDIGHIRVYGFATPSCVSPSIASALEHGKWHERVTVTNVVLRGDIIPVLSYKNCADFAGELVERREEWGPLMKADISGFTSRAMKFWAPVRRTALSTDADDATSTPIEAGASSSSSSKTTDDDDAETKRDDGRSTHEEQSNDIPIFVIPGRIVHLYEWRGTYRATTVDHTFVDFNRIEVNSKSVELHSLEPIMTAMREVVSVRNATTQPPAWTPIESAEEKVICTVCGYDVSWHHTGRSATSTARATHHCVRCGKITCGVCSTRRLPLGELGVLRPRRVCDACVYRMCALPPV